MNLKNKAVPAMLILMYVANAWALDSGMSPGVLPLGPFDLIPLLGIKESYSDNIFNNDRNRKASLITQIGGGGELALRRKLDRYALHYSLLSSQYHASPADDYVDHNFGAIAHFDITRRNRLDLSAGITYAHYMRGTYFSQGAVVSQLLKEPDQYHQYDARLNYRYGRVDAPGNLGLQLGWTHQVYDNHKARTAQWDRAQFEITPGFYFRLMPKTYLTAEVQNRVLKYDNNESSDPLNSSGVDYNTHRYLLGMTWDQSSKTQGSFRAGYQQQEFTNSAIQGTGGLTWDGRVHWSPLTYSSFDFGMLRDIQPTIGSGFFRQVQVYNAGWTHQWPGRITTQLNASYQQAKYQGSTQQSSGMSFGFDTKYAMKPWLDLGLNYSYSDFQYETNDSTSTKNSFMLYINATPRTGTSR